MLSLLLEEVLCKACREAAWLTWEIQRRPQFHQGYVTVMASVVVVLVVDDLLHSISCVMSHFRWTASDNTSIDHPAGYLRQPVADIWHKERAGR